jgi:hypothetical protein
MFDRLVLTCCICIGTREHNALHILLLFDFFDFLLFIIFKYNDYNPRVLFFQRGWKLRWTSFKYSLSTCV